MMRLLTRTLSAKTKTWLASLLLLCGMLPSPIYADSCCTPGRDGAGVNITGIINTYWPATTATLGTGSTSVALGGYNVSGASTPIAAGDMLMIMQMQDATIDATNTDAYGDGVAGGSASGTTGLNNSGRYEFIRATNAVSTAGGTLTFIGTGTGNGTNYAYANAGSSGTRSQQRYQVIRVPQFLDASLGANLTAAPWNGSSGGILALDVAGTLDLNNGSASVAGLGFRGGLGRNSGSGSGSSTDYRTPDSNLANGSKGEGIAGAPDYVFWNGTPSFTGVTYPDGSYGRGAPANGGGGGTDGNPAANDQNTGGGGGGNGGTGGKGGRGWCSNADKYTCSDTGGFGGAAVSGIGVTRLILGGGGGASTMNNNTGDPSGGSGGGAIFVRAGLITGSGAMNANGNIAPSTTTFIDNDGSGGGGAGGSVLVWSRNASTASLNISATGGDGGSNTGGGVAHGPGGGGGGGAILTNLASGSRSISGGAAGTTVTSNITPNSANYNATAGAAGTSTTVAGASIPGVSSGTECAPVPSKSFAPSPVSISANSTLTVILANPNPTLAMNGVAFTDTYPAGMTSRATPAFTNSCGGSISGATNGSTSFSLSGGSIPASGSCTITITVRSTIAGARINTLATGTITTTNQGGNAVPGSGTLMVTVPLTLVKSASTHSDPFNDTINPKSIPGSFTTYTITVTNGASNNITSNSINLIDAVPANTELYVNDVNGAGSGPVAYNAGTSGLTYTFTSLASGTDRLDFSNNGGATYTYSPTPNIYGVDPSVTNIRIRPGAAAMGTNRSFTVSFRVRVK
jgi:hypothetical protein